MTFNHAQYIKDAMNGFCMQETNFPFVCTIIDDASTDGEPGVIKHYLEEHFDLEDHAIVRNEETDDYVLTFAQHKMNKNCYFAVLYLKYNHFSVKKSKTPYIQEWQDQVKYIALCEGDDYWITIDKLQMQVDYLESNDRCYLCGTNGLVLWEGATQNPHYFKNDFVSHWYSVEDILGYWAFPTASLVVKASVYENYPEWTKKIYSGDMTLILICAHKSNGVYSFGNITCVYRRDTISSASLSMKTSCIKVIEHHIMLYEEFNKYTDFQYVRSVNKQIDYEKVQLKYVKLRNKSSILPWIIMPQYCMKISYMRLRNFFHKPKNAFFVIRVHYYKS